MLLVYKNDKNAWRRVMHIGYIDKDATYRVYCNNPSVKFDSHVASNGDIDEKRFFTPVCVICSRRHKQMVMEFQKASVWG